MSHHGEIFQCRLLSGFAGWSFLARFGGSLSDSGSSSSFCKICKIATANFAPSETETVLVQQPHEMTLIRPLANIMMCTWYWGRRKRGERGNFN